MNRVDEEELLGAVVKTLLDCVFFEDWDEDIVVDIIYVPVVVDSPTDEMVVNIVAGPVVVAEEGPVVIVVVNKIEVGPVMVVVTKDPVEFVSPLV